MANSKLWMLALLIVLVTSFGSVGAEIIEIKKVGNKTVSCMRTGLMSEVNDCGAHADWYSYVFVGSISGIATAENDENEIQIIPEEVFHGEPATPLRVRTSQAACWPAMAVGDRWLFFLREEKGKPVVLDYYGNDSRPVADAREGIETLRRLQNIGDNAILRGRVMRGSSFSQADAVANARVVARGPGKLQLAASQFVAVTDADGRYEFQPIPPGLYKITVDEIGRFRADEASIGLAGGACRDVTLSRASHARLGGHVRLSNGSPSPQLTVVMMDEDGSGFTTVKSNEDGSFHFDGIEPGKYVVGIRLPGAPDGELGGCSGACQDKIPAASMYYPGMMGRSEALVINLATNQKRDDIDFIMP